LVNLFEIEILIEKKQYQATDHKMFYTEKYFQCQTFSLRMLDEPGRPMVSGLR